MPCEDSAHSLGTGCRWGQSREMELQETKGLKLKGGWRAQRWTYVQCGHTVMGQHHLLWSPGTTALGMKLRTAWAFTFSLRDSHAFLVLDGSLLTCCLPAEDQRTMWLFNRNLSLVWVSEWLCWSLWVYTWPYWITKKYIYTANTHSWEGVLLPLGWSVHWGHCLAAAEGGPYLVATNRAAPNKTVERIHRIHYS